MEAAWKTIVIEKSSKLNLKENFVIIQNDEEINTFFIPEIKDLIITSTQCNLTTALINKMGEFGVNVIICDEKRNPSCFLLNYKKRYLKQKCNNGYEAVMYKKRVYIFAGKKCITMYSVPKAFEKKDKNGKPIRNYYKYYKNYECLNKYEEIA